LVRVDLVLGQEVEAGDLVRAHDFRDKLGEARTVVGPSSLIMPVEAGTPTLAKR
jgi:hypothetical protein